MAGPDHARDPDCTDRGDVFFALATITANTNKYISNLAYRIKRGEQEALIKMPVGILIYDDQMNVEWTNPYLAQYFTDATFSADR